MLYFSLDFFGKGVSVIDIFSDVKNLSGVGKKRLSLYNKLGIYTIKDLLYHFPSKYTDYSSPIPIQNALLDEVNIIRATVTKKLPAQRIKGGLTLYKVVATDYISDITIVFYNNFYAWDALSEDTEYFFSGKVSGNFIRKEMYSPTVLPVDSDELVIPNYHLTEGLTSKMIRTNIKEALKIFDEYPYDFMPKEILSEYKLCSLSYALANIHFPKDENTRAIALKRLSFDELFLLQTGLLYLKRRNRSLTGCRMVEKDISAFHKSLPFEMTGAQKKAVAEITSDMQREIPMNRLLQGDVGSGKTAVAAAACYFAYENGCQSALMAPTEILATQHYETLNAFLSPLEINVSLLTGSMTAKQKKEVKEKLLSGECDVIVGTHALITATTEFKKLGLVITDEQHRFGVNQRATLAEKGENPHKLVMSATPIPRTMGLVVYGDLDISILNELPKGRIPIETYAIKGEGLRNRAFGFVKNQLDEGRRGYIVCPMIDETEDDSELKSVKEYHKKISEGFFKDYKTDILHGKMTSAEKDDVMSRFKNGEIQLLVSTTVVEVGVDVPNATIILIENADRFGLSQLHQLRGRVGRGKHKSYCILLTENLSEDTKKRLQIMTSTTDGFKISEEDMLLRGCGDFFGESQHGLPPLKIADFDSVLLSETQTAAKKIIEKDEDLSLHNELKKAVNSLFFKESENILN